MNKRAANDEMTVAIRGSLKPVDASERGTETEKKTKKYMEDPLKQAMQVDATHLFGRLAGNSE